jgi:acetolactate synthase small subunit
MPKVLPMSSAPAAAERGLSHATCFSVHARSEPGVMPRVLELFAKRGLVPQKCNSARVGPGGAALTIDVEIGGLERDTVDYVANCMRQIIGVEVVLTAENRPRP